MVFGKRESGIVLTLLIAVVGAVVGGVVLFTSSKASDVDLTSARFVPADAGAYIAFNTDLSSSQWISAFRIVERLGQDDPEGEIKKSAADEGQDWEKDIVPFLGGNAGFYMHGVDLSFGSFQGAVIIRCTDVNRALEVVLKESPGELKDGSYNGIAYKGDADQETYVAAIDGHLVLATDEDSLKEVIDVHAGKKPSLDGVTDYKNLRDELTANFLVFTYVDTKALVGDTFFNDPIIKKAFDQAGASDLAFKPLGAVVAANGNAFQFQEASLGKASSISPLLEPRKSRFVAVVPSDTAIFVDTTHIAQVWGEMVKSAGEQIDDAIAQGGTYMNLQDALNAAGKEMGLSSAQDIIDLFSGETALAFSFPDNRSDSPEWVILAEVSATTKAQNVLSAVARTSATRGTLRTENVGGVSVTWFGSSDGAVIGVGVKDDYLFIGSEKEVRTVLAGGASLASNADYMESVKQMPSALGSYVYLDLATIIDVSGATGGSPEAEEAREALQGMILNEVQERGVVRFNGILAVKK